MRRTVQKPTTLAARSLSRLVATCVAGALLLGVTAVQAGLTPEQKCQVGKNKAAGKYAACRQNAEAALATKGDVANHDKAVAACATSFSMLFRRIQRKP